MTVPETTNTTARANTRSRVAAAAEAAAEAQQREIARNDKMAADLANLTNIVTQLAARVAANQMRNEAEARLVEAEGRAADAEVRPPEVEVRPPCAEVWPAEDEARRVNDEAQNHENDEGDFRHGVNARRAGGSQESSHEDEANGEVRQNDNRDPVPEEEQNIVNHHEVADDLILAELRALRNEVRELRAAQNRTPEIREMLDEVASPFTIAIRREAVPYDFKIPKMAKYDGTGDPVDHIRQYRTLMRINRATPSLMCMAFDLTLTDNAYRWFSKLKAGTIGSFDELRTLFLERFIGSRKASKTKTYLRTIKQGKNESLQDYLNRFHNEANKVDKYDDIDAINAITEGLHRCDFQKSLVGKIPKSMNELITRSRQYVSVDDFYAEKAERREDQKRKAEEETDPEHEDKKSKDHDNSGFENARTYTVLNTPQEYILAQIQDANLLVRPPRQRSNPDQRDRTKFCNFHGDHGHHTSHCINLKRKIETLVQQGYLGEFVDANE